jgi:hypothetical protein
LSVTQGPAVEKEKSVMSNIPCHKLHHVWYAKY